MKKLLDGAYQLPDPLYGFIEVDEDIRSHILDGEALEAERGRAKRLFNLGLVRYVFPSASHTKWEHHLGTHHVIVEAQKHSKLLSTDDFQLLRYLNFFSCFGYPALGYGAAEAILVAAERSDKYRKELLGKFLQPVYEIANKFGDKHDEYRVRTRPEDLLKWYRYKALNAWFGAHKLLSLERKAIHRKVWKHKLIAALVGDASRVKKAYFELARLEYLQRDLHYTQIVTFKIPLGRALGDYKKQLLGDTYDDLLESLRATITRDVYTHPAFLTLESLAREAITEALVSGAVTTDELISKDDYWLEEKIGVSKLVPLVERGQEILRESALFDMAQRDAGDADYSSRRDIAKRLYGAEPPGQFGYVTSGTVEQRSFSTAYNSFRAVDVVVFAHLKPKLSHLLRTLKELALIYENTKKARGINVNTLLHKYARQLLEYGFGQQLTINYDGLFQEFQRRYKDAGIAAKLKEYLERVKRDFGPSHQIVATHDAAKPAIFHGRRLAFLLEYIAYAGAGIDPAKELLSIAKELLLSLEPAGNNWEGERLEYLAHLYLMERYPPTTHVVCPRVALLNAQGAATDEVDFVVLDYSGGEPHVLLVECTVSDGEAKARDDAAKVQKLAARLAMKFEDAMIKTLLIGSGMASIKEDKICDEYIEAKDTGLVNARTSVEETDPIAAQGAGKG